MKKTMFSLLTALVMGMAFSACSNSKAPKEGEEAEKTEAAAEAQGADALDALDNLTGNAGEQFVALTKAFVSIVKTSHINGEADAVKFKKAITKYQAKLEKLQKDVEKLSDEDKLKMAAGLAPMLDDLNGLDAEVDRLKKECEAVGVDIYDVED